jgi:YbbR domain-containing protein
MTRPLRFLLRNWPLKLGAVLLASVLYSGLVLSQNVRTFAGPVQIEAIRQPPGVALLTELPALSQVRYRAPLDVIVSPTTFSATADLSRVQARAGGVPVPVPVTVVALDTRVQVVGHEPDVIQVHLDPVESRTIQVRTEYGTVPEGLTLGSEQVEPQSVTVRGPSTRVAAIRAIVARVAVDASALNVDREVDLIAIDEQGNVVTNVDVEPPRARVRIPVARQLANRTLPVVAELTGDLANGLRVTDIDVTPVTVTVSGDETVVMVLDGARTMPIDLSGRTRDFEMDVQLDLPEGVTVTGPGEVRISVSISEEEATRSYQVGVVPIGARPGFEYGLGSTQVSVALGGPLSALERIDASGLTASLDVAELEAGRHMVPVTFNAPFGLEEVSTTPEEVLVVVTEVLPEPSPDATEEPFGQRYAPPRPA